MCILQINETATCFDVRAERWYPVANVSIPHSIYSWEYAEAGGI